MTATDTRQFMALMTIAQHHGRPGTPTDQAHIESFFSHLKGDWPHLTAITDPAALDTELARIRNEYNTVRLHAAIGYVTPDDEHHGRGPGDPARPPRRAQTRPRRPDQAQSTSEQITPGAPWQIRLTPELRERVCEHAPDSWLPLKQAAEAPSASPARPCCTRSNAASSPPSTSAAASAKAYESRPYPTKLDCSTTTSERRRSASGDVRK